jgi:phospholipase C
MRSLGLALTTTLLAIGCSGAGATANGDGADTGTGHPSDASTQTTGDDAGGNDDSATTAPTTSGDAASDGDGGKAHAIKTVFLIMMENHSWSDIKGSGSAPFINGTMLPMAAYATNYKTPPGNHPSETNYIWLEAGSNLSITNDNPPANNHQSTPDHLVTQLEKAGVTWKSYQEDVDGKSCPLADNGLYAVRHNPAVFFDDVTDSMSASSSRCIAHVRPYTELATDLSAGTTAQFNFITPDLCHDMHGQPIGTTCLSLTSDLVKEGDTWLSTEVPKIMASDAYKNGGAIFVIWDEGSSAVPLVGTASDGPIGAIVLSPLAKVGADATAYTHSSTLKTIEEIFGVALLRGAADPATTDLSAMFTAFP